jgi:hypothetical protein
MRTLWLAARLLPLAALLGAPAVQAVPITYFFDSGSIDVTASTGTTGLGGGTVALDGTSVEFDATGITLDDFEFTATSQGPIMLSISYAGYDTITLDTLLIEPDIGYTTLFGFGSNPYTVTVGPLSVSGTATITDSGAILPDIIGTPFGFPTPSLTATITISGGMMQTLELTGLTLGEIGPFGGETEALTLKGDITFVGEVPEPSTALLVGLGLAALGASRRRS